jgi:signal peptidase II
VGAQGLTPPRLAVVVVATVVLLDQATKAWALAALDPDPIRLIDGFLQLRLTFNSGAAFSNFQGAGPLIGIIALGVAGWIVMMLRNHSAPLETWSLALVLGGALGNLIDRIARGDGLLNGSVVDFIDFSFFPTFNVADSAITIGAALLILAAFRSGRS